MERAKFRTLIPLFDELHGERVVIRPYREEDAQALFEAVAESREHIRPWLPFADQHQSVDESRDWIIKQKAQWLLRDNMNLAIWEAADPKHYLGGMGLHPHNWDTGYFEIGYWLRKSAEGKGYMSEAVRLLTDYALNELKAQRVEIRCDQQNIRSAAVARRLGFVEEGVLRNESTEPGGSVRSTLVFSRIPSDEGMRVP
jgi:RimJ/RimL family protein N-acetyltransferase